MATKSCSALASAAAGGSSREWLPSDALALPTASTMAGKCAVERSAAMGGECHSYASENTHMSAKAASRNINEAASGCKLQIKGDTGRVVCILDLPPTAPLFKVREALQASQMGDSPLPSSVKFTLYTAYPAKALADETQTLEGLGLVPSATLYVRTN